MTRQRGDEPIDYYDYEAPSIRRSRSNTQLIWLPVAIAVASMLIQLAAMVWWGGRLAQRVDTVEQNIKDTRSDLNDVRNENGRQNTTLGIIGQQYGDISGRLQRIESKLDRH